MWACFDSEVQVSVDEQLLERITGAYFEEVINNNNAIEVGEDGSIPNPIVKRKLILSENNRVAVITETKVQEHLSQPNANGNAGSPTTSNMNSVPSFVVMGEL